MKHKITVYSANDAPMVYTFEQRDKDYELLRQVISLVMSAVSFDVEGNAGISIAVDMIPDVV